MTGFGRGSAKSGAISVACEVKTVNNRFLDVNIRLPRPYWGVEHRVREAIAARLQRGRVDIFFNVEEQITRTTAVRFNDALAAQYVKKIRKLQESAGLSDTVSTSDVLRLDGVIHTHESDPNLDEHWTVMEQALDAAMKRLLEMRKKEGAALRKELLRVHKELLETAKAMGRAIPATQEALRARLSARIQEWAGAPGADPVRLNQEIAVLLAKSDVTEEVARLGGHLDELKSALAGDSPVGKRLDFLVQEIHREITTFGNKIQGLEISKLVVDAKSGAERLREQLQNIE